jgi:high-affinity iron transporter
MREGSEKVLFLVYRLVAVGGSSAASVLISSVSSLVAGCAVIAFTYVGLVMIPPRHLFRVSPALTRFLATGLATRSILFFQQAAIVTALPQIHARLSPSTCT